MGYIKEVGEGVCTGGGCVKGGMYRKRVGVCTGRGWGEGGMYRKGAG